VTPRWVKLFKSNMTARAYGRVKDFKDRQWPRPDVSAKNRES